MKSVKAQEYKPTIGEGFYSETVNLEALKSTGVPFAKNGIAKGDEISFPETLEDVSVRKQNVRKKKFDGPQQFLVTVIKNGRVGEVALGSLRRTGKDFSTSCPFIEDMVKNYDNDLERVKSLLGKTIVCNELKEMESPVFTAEGERTDQFEVRKFPVIEIAEPKKNIEFFQ